MALDACRRAAAACCLLLLVSLGESWEDFELVVPTRFYNPSVVHYNGSFIVAVRETLLPGEPGVVHGRCDPDLCQCLQLQARFMQLPALHSTLLIDTVLHAWLRAGTWS
jgi:hypothetical protein